MRSKAAEVTWAFWGGERFWVEDFAYKKHIFVDKDVYRIYVYLGQIGYNLPKPELRNFWGFRY